VALAGQLVAEDGELACAAVGPHAAGEGEQEARAAGALGSLEDDEVALADVEGDGSVDGSACGREREVLRLDDGAARRGLGGRRSVRGCGREVLDLGAARGR